MKNIWLLLLTTYVFLGFLTITYLQIYLRKYNLTRVFDWSEILLWPVFAIRTIKTHLATQWKKKHMGTLVIDNTKWLSTIMVNELTGEFGVCTIDPNAVVGQMMFTFNSTVLNKLEFTYGCKESVKPNAFYINGQSVHRDVWIAKISVYGYYGRYLAREVELFDNYEVI